MKPAKIKGIEEIELVICNVNGNDLLFTSDGKLLANQGSGGHIYYIPGSIRYKTFRTSLLVDHKTVKVDDNFLTNLQK
jgi:hypothetical protein